MYCATTDTACGNTESDSVGLEELLAGYDQNCPGRREGRLFVPERTLYNLR